MLTSELNCKKRHTIKIIIVLFLDIFLWSLSYGQNHIHYYTSYLEGFKYGVLRENNVLKASINDKVYTIISEGENLCLEVEKVADFDNNGFQDALVKILNGCGANCCGYSYLIISFDGNRFRRSVKIGYDWNKIQIAQVDLDYYFIVSTKNIGNNFKPKVDIIETYKLVNFQLELIHKFEEKRLNALFDISSADFSYPLVQNEVKNLIYDINTDGFNDTLRCTINHWILITADCNISGIASFEINENRKMKECPNRIGILPTKTKGFHDIVLDINTILKWNGYGYNCSNCD